MRKLRSFAFALLAFLFAACGTGVDAGGESLGENGSVAFILFAIMLIGIGLIMWWIMGRED
jgi:hypothetical protein